MSALLAQRRSFPLHDRAHPAPDTFEQHSHKPPGIQGDSAGFASILNAYRGSGGTARGDDLACLMKEHLRGDYISLARLLVNGGVFGFTWRGVLWIPMFQFELRDLAVKSGSRLVLAELASTFDNWAVATWFAEGNSWLDGRPPVDMLDRDLPKVLEAARAGRFIAAG
jgi:hypothetical protein